jgi:hypothetical protein
MFGKTNVKHVKAFKDFGRYTRRRMQTDRLSQRPVSFPKIRNADCERVGCAEQAQDKDPM